MQNITTTTDSIGSCTYENIAKPRDTMCNYYKEYDYLPKGKSNIPKYSTFGLEKYYNILIKELKKYYIF